MTIGEPAALLGEAIDVWSRHKGVRVVTTRVAVAHVVGEDVDDVGMLRGVCALRPCACGYGGCAGGL